MQICIASLIPALRVSVRTDYAGLYHPTIHRVAHRPLNSKNSVLVDKVWVPSLSSFSAQCSGIAVQRCCHFARPQACFLLPQTLLDYTSGTYRAQSDEGELGAEAKDPSAVSRPKTLRARPYAML